jgi:putative hydrolase of the HAD superfamily
MADDPGAVATVFVDADNTLWDTDGVYAAAQLKLLAAVEDAIHVRAGAPDRLAYVRVLDQDLAQRHHAGLRYPAKLLAHALASGLQGQDAPTAVRRALLELDHGGALEAPAAEAATSEFFAALKALPPLRPGVEQGLRNLRDMRCLVIVVTEGAQARIASTANALGVTPYIDRLIEAPKQRRLYERVARLSHAPQPMFMVGDQLQRDIAPAKEAGLETIYFPGNFTPKWEPAEDLVRPDHRVTNFNDVAQIVADRLSASPASRRQARSAQPI